jgi:GST-like protein
MTPIRLYTWGTPNGQKASIMLEEVGLPYEVVAIDVSKGGTQTPDYLAMNPNGKIPMIEDPNTGRIVVESGAILLYLAERSGKLQPQDGDRTLEFLFFQAAHVGPMLGQLGYFKIFAAEKIPAAIERFQREAGRVLGVLDSRLGHSAYLGGEAFGLADIMTWPWIASARKRLGFDLVDMPNLSRWADAIAERPAVQRGMAVPAPA